jgi:hypothetical protein
MTIIRKMLNDAVDKCTATRRQKDYYKATEKILYSLDKLRIKAETDRQDILDMVREKENKAAVHKIEKAWGPELDDDVRHKQKIRNRERAMFRTERLISRVNKCLKQLQKDEWFKVLEMTYLTTPPPTSEEIAASMFTSIATIYRHKKRLINELSILFYGADALDI